MIRAARWSEFNNDSFVFKFAAKNIVLMKTGSLNIKIFLEIICLLIQIQIPQSEYYQSCHRIRSSNRMKLKL